MNIDNLRHGDVICTAAHGNCNVQTACAHREHTDAAAGRGVAVGTDQGFAGLAETLQMHLVADAVTGAGEANASFFCDRLNKAVVVGVFKAGLQGVVVDIRHGKLGTHARHAHRFKFQIRHGAGGVLGQRLVDF